MTIHDHPGALFVGGGYNFAGREVQVPTAAVVLDSISRIVKTCKPGNGQRDYFLNPAKGIRKKSHGVQQQAPPNVKPLMPELSKAN